VIAVKEATGDLLYGGELLTRTRTPVLSGDDFTFLPLLAMGGAGCISVVSNVAPATTVAVWQAFRDARNDDARRLMHDLWPLVSFLFSDTNPVPCKAALAAQGICGPHVRSPLAPFEGVVPRELVGLP
jgi:4-hydroxy-tetrahydrodipicolinate synthase